MITQDQAEQVANNILEQPQKELDAKRSQRRAVATAVRKRRESPLFPALIAAITVLVALEYLENTLVCVLLGTVVGGLFGWAARRSS